MAGPRELEESARGLMVAPERRVETFQRRMRLMSNLVRWDPFGEMDRLLRGLMPQSGGSWPRLALSEDGGTRFEWSPSADISETDKEYLVRAELPAVKKEDVKVTVDNGMLTIEGERKQEKEEKTEKFHRVESFHGSFSRSFSLPENVDAANIKCDSKDGVLTVHIPKKEAAKPKPIEITVQ
jgi:HSP20 family protein